MISLLMMCGTSFSMRMNLLSLAGKSFRCRNNIHKFTTFTRTFSFLVLVRLIALLLIFNQCFFEIQHFFTSVAVPTLFVREFGKWNFYQLDLLFPPPKNTVVQIVTTASIADFRRYSLHPSHIATISFLRLLVTITCSLMRGKQSTITTDMKVRLHNLFWRKKLDTSQEKRKPERRDVSLTVGFSSHKLSWNLMLHRYPKARRILCSKVSPAGSSSKF